MKSRILFLLLFLCGALSQAQGLKMPLPDSHSCSFYLLLEDQVQCQASSNYLTAYAYHYCQKFKQAKTEWSPKLQHWVEQTTYCLQDSLARKAGEWSSCQELEDAGVRSHQDCYVRAGFCDLSLRQKMKILRTVSVADLLKYKGSLSRFCR